MKIAVIGAGHAGVEAALAASKAGAQVTLFSREAALPYYRPRLVSVAFGQTEPGAIAMHPESWYAQNGIDLRLETTVVGLDPAGRTLQVRERDATPASTPFDGIVIAAGADPVVPGFPGTGRTALLPLWQLGDAVEIRRRFAPGKRLVVIGGGLIGIETAVRAVMAGLQVTIIEKAPRLMCSNLGPAAAGLLCRLLEEKGVRILTGASIEEVRSEAGANALILEDGSRHEFDMGLVCIGARANLDLLKGTTIQAVRGVMVDSTLRTTVPRVYACGDVAQIGNVVRCSALRASAQGRVAGKNVCAEQTGNRLEDYVAMPEPVFLKCGDIEIHAFGSVADATTQDCSKALFDSGGPQSSEGIGRDGCPQPFASRESVLRRAEDPTSLAMASYAVASSAPYHPVTEALLDPPSERTCRVSVLQNGRPVGVQMIGTKTGFDKYVNDIA